jgi:hypothetical protein
LSFLLFIAVVIILTVIPVMIAAKFLGAERTSFISCLMVVIASVASEHIGSNLVESEVVAGVIAIGFTALCISMILGAKYIQSIVIAVLSIGVQFGLALLLAGLGLASGVVEFGT